MIVIQVSRRFRLVIGVVLLMVRVLGADQDFDLETLKVAEGESSDEESDKEMEED